MAKKRKRNAKAARSRKGSSRRSPSRKKKRHRLSKKAREWISRKIRFLYKEGYSGKQAVAVAMSMARRRGFTIPAR